VGGLHPGTDQPRRTGGRGRHEAHRAEWTAPINHTLVDEGFPARVGKVDHQLDRDEARLDPAGEFPDGFTRFGSGAYKNEKPQHRVRINATVLPGRVRGDSGGIEKVMGPEPEPVLGGG